MTWLRASGYGLRVSAKSSSWGLKPKADHLAAQAAKWPPVSYHSPVTTKTSEVPSTALTTLAPDELLFRDSVYEFATRELRPLVRQMDEQAHLADGLLEKLFDLGVMGIEIPDRFGGSGASFFHSVLAIESLSR